MQAVLQGSKRWNYVKMCEWIEVPNPPTTNAHNVRFSSTSPKLLFISGLLSKKTRKDQIAIPPKGGLQVDSDGICKCWNMKCISGIDFPTIIRISNRQAGDLSSHISHVDNILVLQGLLQTSFRQRWISSKPEQTWNFPVEDLQNLYEQHVPVHFEQISHAWPGHFAALLCKRAAAMLKSSNVRGLTVTSPNALMADIQDDVISSICSFRKNCLSDVWYWSWCNHRPFAVCKPKAFLPVFWFWSAGIIS